MTDLVFEEPPAKTNSNLAEWTERLALLAEHPGEWVNATATWGPKALNSRGPAFKAAADLGVTIEVRNTAKGRSKNNIEATCHIRVLAPRATKR